jgi:hypothetical protein
VPLQRHRTPRLHLSGGADYSVPRHSRYSDAESTHQGFLDFVQQCSADLPGEAAPAKSEAHDVTDILAPGH